MAGISFPGGGQAGGGQGTVTSVAGADPVDGDIPRGPLRGALGLLDDPTARLSARRTAVTDEDRPGAWLDGTGGYVQDPVSKDRFIWSTPLFDTVVLRTTVTGSGDTLVIDGDPVTTVIDDQPDGAIVLGGKILRAGDIALLVTHTNREATDPDLSGHIWSSVGLAISTTWADATPGPWSYLGDVVQVEIGIDDPAVGGNTIGSFTSYGLHTWNGILHLFLLHADQLADGTQVRQTISRAPLADVLAAAEDGQAFAGFEKWDGESFGAPGSALGGTPGPLLGYDESWGVMLHVEVLWSTSAQRWLMFTSEQDGDGTKLGVHSAVTPEGPWTPRHVIDEGDATAGLHPYSTLLADPDASWRLTGDVVEEVRVVNVDGWDDVHYDLVTYDLTSFDPVADEVDDLQGQVDALSAALSASLAKGRADLAVEPFDPDSFTELTPRGSGDPIPRAYLTGAKVAVVDGVADGGGDPNHIGIWQVPASGPAVPVERPGAGLTPGELIVTPQAIAVVLFTGTALTFAVYQPESP